MYTIDRANPDFKRRHWGEGGWGGGYTVHSEPARRRRRRRKESGHNWNQQSHSRVEEVEETEEGQPRAVRRFEDNHERERARDHERERERMCGEKSKAVDFDLRLRRSLEAVLGAVLDTHKPTRKGAESTRSNVELRCPFQIMIIITLIIIK